MPCGEVSLRINLSKNQRSDWLVVWVLWHINLCRLFNDKFCLYEYTFKLRFLNEYLVGKIFDKQDFICLQTINRFQFVIFLVQYCLSQKGQNLIHFDNLEQID